MINEQLFLQWMGTLKKTLLIWKLPTGMSKQDHNRILAV